MKTKTLNLDEGLDALKDSSIVGVMVVGDISEKTLHTVLDVLDPTPVKVAASNANDKTIQNLMEHDVQLGIGPLAEPRKPELTVFTAAASLRFGGEVTLKPGGSGFFKEIGSMLVPFGGHSLDSSLVQAIPARLDFLNWLARGGKGASANILAFGRLRSFPTVRNVLLGLFALLIGFGPLTGSSIPGFPGGTALFMPFYLSFNPSRLRHRFGTDNE